MPWAPLRLQSKLSLIAAISVVVACSGGSEAGPGSRRPTGGPAAGAAANSGGLASAGAASFPGNNTGPVLPPSNPGSVAQPPQLAPQGERTMESMRECDGKLDPTVLAELRRTDLPQGSSRLLYPYDRTVFPRGLPAPVLQWDGVAADSVYVHARSMLFEYEGCWSGSMLSNIALPQAAWDRAADQSLGKGDPLVVEISLASGGTGQRLPTVNLVFALASLRAAVYYNTYGSLLANQQGAVGGVVMRVIPGEAEPSVFLTAPAPTHCIGCHSVSADGSRMVAEVHMQPGLTEDLSSSYDLTTVGTMTNPPPLKNDLKRAGFAALYPDGSVYLTTGRIAPGPIGSLPGTPPGNVPGTFGPEPSRLFDTNTGAELSGSGIAEYAYMPSFSVDGSMVAFNQMDASGAPAGHTLAVMDYDHTGKTFTNQRPVLNDPMQYPSWPGFLPDVVDKTVEFEIRNGKRVVFQLGANSDFTTQEQPVGVTPHPADLYWVDVDSGKVAPLSAANGLDASGAVTLPYGERDAHKNYIPTVSPVAAGGYFWVFFTSKRNYGNLYVADPPELRAEGKKIWVTALDINAPPGTDPSHPAFFLPGQELESGNIRAFAALEPCRENGSTCESGIDCCCGFCTEGVCACGTECSHLEEKCTTAGDCCDKTQVCVGGFCGFVNPS
jgi:hypothetical protein